MTSNRIRQIPPRSFFRRRITLSKKLKNITAYLKFKQKKFENDFPEFCNREITSNGVLIPARELTNRGRSEG